MRLHIIFTRLTLGVRVEHEPLRLGVRFGFFHRGESGYSRGFPETQSKGQELRKGRRQVYHSLTEV